MKISGVLWRFLAAYIGLTIVVMTGFALAGLRPNAGLNVAVLFGAVFWPCLAFGKKNARYFSAIEKKWVVWGMIAIDLALQLAVSASLLGSTIASGKPVLGLMLAGVVFVMAIHALVIVFLVGYAGKLFAKDQARALAKAGG